MSDFALERRVDPGPGQLWLDNYHGNIFMIAFTAPTGRFATASVYASICSSERLRINVVSGTWLLGNCKLIYDGSFRV